jgi:hypothetical protein
MRPTKGQPSGERADSNVDNVLWAVVGLPTAVECSRALLEEIHGEVQDGFRRLSRGGVEVGGILFGRRAEGAIRILAWRPLVCEHARGPAFLLSNPDKQLLMQQLEAASRDPQLQVLEPLGWFVSHTRSGVQMTPEDLEIFQQFFPEPWQVTLVFHPMRQEPSQAGFFMRERDGQIRTESSYREFPVEGVRYAKATTRPEPPPDVPAVKPAAKQPGMFDAPNLVMEATGGGHRRVAFAAVSLLIGAIALFAVPRIRQIQPHTEPLNLRMVDAQGQLRIEWDSGSSTVRYADDATLFITDGGKLSPIKLDRDAVLSGSVTYARLTEDVSVRFVVNQKDSQPYQELARYVGPPVPSIEAKELRAALDGKETMQQEAQDLRKELQQESKRTRELEQAIRRLQAQLERESRAR